MILKNFFDFVSREKISNLMNEQSIVSLSIIIKLMNLLIYGTGSLGIQAYRLICEIPTFSCIGFIDDFKDIGTNVIDNLTVFGNKDSLKNHIANNYDFVKECGVVIAIGPKDLISRYKIFTW